MGCFFGCFRIRDGRRPPIHLVSQPITSTPKDHVESVARNRLSSLLLSEAEDRDHSPSKDRKYGVRGSHVADINSNELKAEAKFLKDCGTLPQTPVEIRNTEKFKDSQPRRGDTESSTFHSWLPNTSIEKLKLEKQPDQQPSPIELFEEWENGSDSSSHSPNSCMTGLNTDSTSSTVKNVEAQNAAASFTHVPTTQFKNKSVRFNCEIDASSFSQGSSSSEVTYQESKPPGFQCDYTVSKPSPYPTPLKLTNDMQTPGTVFPAYLHNNETGKNPRIRSQYVYPVKNSAQLKALTEESFGSDHGFDQLEEQLGQDDKELIVDNQDHLFLQVPEFGKTPGDRPILGMVAAHWNADEASSFPPKWWDGNGIPNSTNKYKEDQKVKWHATPFEERLEKALSEDKLIAQRKQHEKVPLLPMDLDEKSLCDSVGPELQPSRHFESGFVLMNKA